MAEQKRNNSFSRTEVLGSTAFSLRKARFLDCAPVAAQKDSKCLCCRVTKAMKRIRTPLQAELVKD